MAKRRGGEKQPNLFFPDVPYTFARENCRKKESIQFFFTLQTFFSLFREL
jgi:hypothetical protein